MEPWTTLAQFHLKAEKELEKIDGSVLPPPPPLTLPPPLTSPPHSPPSPHPPLPSPPLTLPSLSPPHSPPSPPPSQPALHHCETSHHIWSGRPACTQ